MKISKAKLQQLILEEVAKHKKLSEDAIPVDTLQAISISDGLKGNIKALADRFKAIKKGGLYDKKNLN